MKKYIHLTIIVFAFSITSCNDYLDVQPEDKYLQSQVYSNIQALQNAVNGVYLLMARPELYGGNLTVSTVEILAQRYNLSDTRHNWYSYGQYDYTQVNVKSTMDDIWSNGYIAILNINKLLEGLDNSDVIPDDNKAIVRGEMYGLRAMIHLDMLRLFGPIYSASPNDPGIPYYTKAQASAQDILPATEVMTKILEDLSTAETLLADDPILTGSTDDDPESFYANRTFRMNYYAVKALQARANLYAGNTQEAYTAAKVIIDVAGIPWTAPTEVVGTSTPDRIFSSEIIFSVDNPGLPDQHRALFASESDASRIRAFDILAPLPGRLTETFEDNENDYRYNSTWVVPSTGSISYRTFFKFAENGLTRQPLIRKTEMYYVAAETTTDPEEALEYLNTVRFNRGVIPLEPGAEIQPEIEKEYMKEFYGEGQLFFYYKRVNKNRLPDGNRPQSYYTVVMSPAKYVVPLPDSETRFN